MSRKEKHWGVVTDNRDPERRGRLTIECPTVADGDVLEWVDPTFHFVDSAHEAGSFWVPNVDSMVEVEIEAEDDSEATSLEPKWMCSVYPDGSIPEEFLQNYPERRGWKTRHGHLLYFDDTSGDQTFLYRHPSGTEIFVNNSGRIELKPAAGESVFVGDGADQALVKGTNLFTYLDILVKWIELHVHGGVTTGPGSSGPPGVPPPAPVSTTLLSDFHKVK
jgi:hypothetical protein